MNVPMYLKSSLLIRTIYVLGNRIDLKYAVLKKFSEYSDHLTTTTTTTAPNVQLVINLRVALMW